MTSIGHRDERYKQNKIEIKKELTRKKDSTWRFNLHKFTALKREIRYKKICKNQILKYVIQENCHLIKNNYFYLLKITICSRESSEWSSSKNIIVKTLDLNYGKKILTASWEISNWLIKGGNKEASKVGHEFSIATINTRRQWGHIYKSLKD